MVVIISCVIFSIISFNSRIQQLHIVLFLTFEQDKLQIRPALKNCWYAVLLPTHKNWPYPNCFLAILENFFLKNPTTDRFTFTVIFLS